MLNRILKIFEPPQGEPTVLSEQEKEKRKAVAACALLVEIAQSDGSISDVEMQRIVEILESHYGLTGEDAQEIIDTAKKELDESVQMWAFTRLINDNYSIEEKIEVIEMIWHVVYADGKLDRHEDHLVHRLARLLNLTHKQLIEAKIRVLESRMKGN